MGDICRLCEGPHPTRHHGIADGESYPPPYTPAVRWCSECVRWHPRGRPCEPLDDDDERGSNRA